jgi:hypothetical protein
MELQETLPTLNDSTMTACLHLDEDCPHGEVVIYVHVYSYRARFNVPQCASSGARTRLTNY